LNQVELAVLTLYISCITISPVSSPYLSKNVVTKMYLDGF